MYIILTGIPPFNGKDDMQIMSKVSKGEYRLDIPEMENVSALAKKLIKKMLEMSSTKRISAKVAIQDEWFTTMKSNDNVQINLSTLNNLKKLNVS
jgi:calcium-dependent protein kinase